MLKSVGTCVCDLYFNLVGKYCCIYGCMWSIVYFRTQLKSKYFSGLDLGMISYVVGFYKFGEKHLFTPFRCVLSLIFTFTILLSKSKFWLWYYKYCFNVWLHNVPNFRVYKIWIHIFHNFLSLYSILPLLL